MTRHSKDLKPFNCDQDGCHASYVCSRELQRHQKSHEGTDEIAMLIRSAEVHFGRDVSLTMCIGIAGLVSLDLG